MIIVDDFDLLEEAQTLRRNINKMRFFSELVG